MKRHAGTICVHNIFFMVSTFLYPGCFCSPDFIFPADPDQFRNIQQVIQGIGSVPQLMLLPHPGRYRQEKELINIRAGYGAVSAGAAFSLDPPPPKKPDRLQEIPSNSSFIQEDVSCSSSG